MINDSEGEIFPVHADIKDPVEFVAANRGSLTALPICAGISFQLLAPFLRKCEFRWLTAGELLLSPGQANHYLFVLLSGRLMIHIHALESEKGFLVQPGEMIGEVSIIDGLAPTAYVTASERSLIMGIHETVLWTDFIRIPGAARNLLRQIAGRMRARNAAMQKSLEDALRLEHLEKELRIAQELQASMLPGRPFFPNDPQIEADAIMMPAKEIGGDFFDAFPLGDGKICIAIGDVSGKGVPAALFMVRTLTVLRTEMLKAKDALLTIRAMNEALSRDNPMCMFVTLMICVIDLNTGRMRYVNGGHNPPLFGNFSDGFEFAEQPKGILVGINPQADYQMAARNLRDGDTLILYTDGVTEAMNPGQEEFSEKRLLECAGRCKEQTVSGLIAGIQNEVLGFASSAEQSDDLTLLAFRYRNTG